MTGCATAPGKPSVPDSLLVCAETPAVPGPTARAKEAANYIVDLYDAHADCHTKLGAVRQLVRPSE